MKKFIIPILLVISLSLSGCSSYSASGFSASNTQSQSSASPQIEYYFTKAHQHPDQILESQILAAKSTLDIAIYSLTKKEIINAILIAKQRGVNVRLITDQSEAKTKAQSSGLSLLLKAGIPIKENTHSGLMHLKVSIIDKSVVTTGSFNYSQSASTINDEVLVVIHDPNIASQWDDEFNQMWNDPKAYTEINK